MGEIVYKLFFFMMLVIFFSFGFLIKLKIDNWKIYHGLDFISIDNNYQIKTGQLNYKTTNIVYVDSYPEECKNNNKNSFKCLSSLKKQGGVYNGLVFFSGTNLYK